jgi:hypothetical protein
VKVGGARKIAVVTGKGRNECGLKGRAKRKKRGIQVIGKEGLASK